MGRMTPAMFSPLKSTLNVDLFTESLTLVLKSTAQNHPLNLQKLRQFASYVLRTREQQQSLLNLLAHLFLGLQQCDHDCSELAFKGVALPLQQLVTLFGGGDLGLEQGQIPEGS